MLLDYVLLLALRLQWINHAHHLGLLLAAHRMRLLLLLLGRIESLQHRHGALLVLILGIQKQLLLLLLLHGVAG